MMTVATKLLWNSLPTFRSFSTLLSAASLRQKSLLGVPIRHFHLGSRPPEEWFPAEGVGSSTGLGLLSAAAQGPCSPVPTVRGVGSGGCVHKGRWWLSLVTE